MWETDYQDTTRCEMMVYIELLYLIGIKKGHHANMMELFSNNDIGIEIAKAVMSFKRFLFLTCLWFDDKTEFDVARVIMVVRDRWEDFFRFWPWHFF